MGPIAQRAEMREAPGGRPSGPRRADVIAAYDMGVDPYLYALDGG